MNTRTNTPDAGPEPGDADVRRRLSAIDSDPALADAIHQDGTALIRLGLPVHLDRYLAAVRDLARRPEPLDAALSVALTSLVRQGAATTQAVLQLQVDHPELARAIHDAAALNDAMLSTTDLERRVVAPASRDLPSGIGPSLPSGHPRYELLSRLGYGAYGQVYLARDRLLSEPDRPASVAIKVLPAAEGLTVVPEEATKARRVDHPNVVRVLDSGRDQGDDFIVCEYVDGGSLADHLLRRPPPLPARDAADLMLAVSRGVQAAHAAGLVHCDLKPGNILITSQGRPKVADFGIAVRAANGRPHAHATSARAKPLGNLAFISPEQYRAEPESLRPASDVYSLGGLLYLLLTGAMPNGETPEQVASTHDPILGRKEPPEFLARPRLDPDLRRICARALEPDPARRYAAAGQLADDLEAWLNCFPIAWARPGPWRSAQLLARRQPVALLMFGLWSFTLVAAGAVVTLLVRQLIADSATLARQREAALSVRGELPNVVTMEVRMLQPFLSNSAADAAYRRARISSLGQTIELSRRAGREQLLLWSVQEVKLVVWLLADGDWKEAMQIIDGARHRWGELVGPSDPWLDGLDVLACHARTDALLEQARAAPHDALLEQATRLRDTLAGIEARLAVDAPGSGLHAVVLASLEALAGPSLLNDASALRYWMNRRIVCGALPVDAHDSHQTPILPIQERPSGVSTPSP